MYIIDGTTEESYLYATGCQTRFTLILISTLGLPFHIVALVTSVVYRIFRCLSFYSFWKDKEENADFKSRLVEWITDGLRILISPLAIPCLILSSLYGLGRPQDGRKLHAQMEIIFYGHPLLAPCMHPRPLKEVSDNTLRKFQAIITNTIFMDPLKVVVAVIYRILRFFSFYAFWGWPPNRLEDRLIEWIKDGARIFIVPFGIPLSLAVAFYGIIRPEEGQALLVKVHEICYGWYDEGSPISHELREHGLGGQEDQLYVL